jgi:predicted phage-related endonuclease
MGEMQDKNVYLLSQKYGPAPKIGHAVPVLAEALGRDIWLQNRVIGASDAANIMGVGHGSPLSVYRSVVYGEQKTADYSMERGTAMEAFGLSKMVEHTGHEFTKPGWLLRHPEHEFMTCTLDAWHDPTETHGEVKCPGMWTYNDVKADMDAYLAGEEICPAGDLYKWIVQMHHQFEVCGTQGAAPLTVCGDYEARTLWVQRNDALCEQIVQAESDFWEMCKARQEPEALPYDLEAIARAWRRKHGELETRSEKVLELMRKYEEAQALVKEQGKVYGELKDIAEAIKAKLVQRAASIGASKLVVLDGERRHSITHTKATEYVTKREAGFRVNLSRKDR